jgi:serine O-acetyltransferase
LRTAEYVMNCYGGPMARIVGLLFYFRARRAGMRLGFSIPPNVFGPGLSIAHWGTLVVNDRARVGARCRIHPGTCLGTKADASPVLGDDCYVGPGAKIVGGVVLGNGVTIGANAVVLSSFPSGAVLVGIPATDASISEALHEDAEAISLSTGSHER